MRKFFLYYKLQAPLFISLIMICIVPYVINQVYLNKLIPNLHLIFLIMLFVIKILFFRDLENRNKIKKDLREKLLDETGKTPSNKEIEQRVTDLIIAKDVVLVTIGLSVLILFIIT